MGSNTANKFTELSCLVSGLSGEAASVYSPGVDGDGAGSHPPFTCGRTLPPLAVPEGLRRRISIHHVQGLNKGVGITLHVISGTAKRPSR